MKINAIEAFNSVRTVQQINKRIWDIVGSHFESVELLKVSRGDLELHVKTSRCHSGLGPDDCDGTTPPSEIQDLAVSLAARELGFDKAVWHPCEKGWGWYLFVTEKKEATF